MKIRNGLWKGKKLLEEPFRKNDVISLWVKGGKLRIGQHQAAPDGKMSETAADFIYSNFQGLSLLQFLSTSNRKNANEFLIDFLTGCCGKIRLHL